MTPQESEGESQAQARITAETVADLAGHALSPDATGDRTEAQIGAYVLLRQLGEGGMGVVYHARQSTPIRRDVALKIIKPGMDSKHVVARFETERQALALMDHPNISRVFDAGATSTGRPFFVMELVAEAVPITHYCDAHQLSVRERLQLMIPVCEAVQHAHQKGVIHRDLKPSNVVVAQQDGRAVPKVIDFGIAKATGPQLTDSTLQTQIGTVIGTFEYMSPEQADPISQDIDTRTDIYSLGAVLYELLTGFTPLDFTRPNLPSYVEVLRRIREDEPFPPSTCLVKRGGGLMEIAARRGTDESRLIRSLRGELDWIVTKALEKDRSRRYETAGALGRDLQRYLSNEPVDAGPISATYRLGKLARRYKVWLVTAAAVFALLVAAVAFSTWQAVKARRAEQVARAVSSFQTDLLAQASAVVQSRPDTKPDPDLKVRTVLDRAVAGAGSRFAGQPLIEGAIRQTAGLAYRDLGLYDQAREQLERAIELFRRAMGPNQPQTWSAMTSLGEIAVMQGKYQQGETIHNLVFAAQRRSLGPENPDTLDTMAALGRDYQVQAKYPEAERLFSDLAAVRRRVMGPEDPRTLASLASLASVYSNRSKYAEAAALKSQVLDAQKRVLGVEHPSTLLTMTGLAQDYLQEGKYPQAEALHSQALEIKRRVLGPEHPDTLASMNEVAVVKGYQGKFSEEIAIYVPLLEARRRLSGPEDPETLILMHNLAGSYYSAGKFAESEDLFLQTLEGERKRFGPEHKSTLVTMGQLADTYRGLNKLDEAETLHNQVIAVLRRTLGTGNQNTLLAINSLAFDYRKHAKYAQAEVAQREASEGFQRVLGAEHPNTLLTTVSLALVYHLENKDRQAEDVLRPICAIYERTLPDNWQRYRCQSLLGASLSAQKKYQEAEPLLLAGYRGMIERQARIPAASKSYLDDVRGWITRHYRLQGKLAQAAEWQSK
jgi:serine/threonine protein kinase